MNARHAAGTLLIVLIALGSAAPVPARADQFSWSRPHATVLPTGNLQWRPEPFVYRAGQAVRYIDFDTGDDANPGSRQRP